MAASGISLLRRGGALPQSSTCRNRRRGTEKQSSEVVIMSTTSSSLSSLPTPPSAPSPSPSASSAHSLRSRRPLRTPSTSLRSSGSEVLAPTPRKALLSNTERRPQATRKGAHKIERGARDIVTAASTFHNVPTTVAGSHAALTGTHRGVHAVWRDRRTHAVGRQRPGGITTLRGPLRTRARSGSGPSSSLPPSAIDLPSDDVLESDTEIGGIASHQPSGGKPRGLPCTRPPMTDLRSYPRGYEYNQGVMMMMNGLRRCWRIRGKDKNPWANEQGNQ